MCPRMPQYQRIFIGYGAFFTDPAELDAIGSQPDGRCGSTVTALLARVRNFGPHTRGVSARGRQGRHASRVESHARRAKPRKHTIRYRSRTGNRTTDATWVFHIYRP